MNKIKSLLESEKGKDILIALVVILVGVGSFELGRLSRAGDSPGIKIEYPPEVLNQPANAVSATNPSSVLQKTEIPTVGKKFFASNRGKKYYPVGCSAGASLKEENKIWFNTREEAEAAGYELSSSCR